MGQIPEKGGDNLDEGIVIVEAIEEIEIPKAPKRAATKRIASKRVASKRVASKRVASKRMAS
jgi:hypothetical protein